MGEVLLLNSIRSFLLVVAVGGAMLAGCGMQAQEMQARYAPRLPSENVPYNYRWELYGGLAYSHFFAGPEVSGTNLYGFDAEAARYLSNRWAVVASGRGYYGSTDVLPNPYGVTRPPVSEYMFLGGAQYRIEHNPRLSFTLHALAGGAYNVVNSGVKYSSGKPLDPELVGLYKNQFSRGAFAFGGSVDWNLSERWAVRISPEATLTNYQTFSGQGGLDAQYAASVGVVYRFRRGLRE